MDYLSDNLKEFLLPLVNPPANAYRLKIARVVKTWFG